MHLRPLVAGILILLCASAARAADPTAKELLTEAKAAAQGQSMQDDMYEEIAYWQAVMGDLEGAKVTAESIPNAQRRGPTWGRIAQALAAAGNIQGATDLLANIKDAQGISSVRASIAAAQARTGDLKAALATCATITDAFNKDIALEIIAQAQAESGDQKGAEATIGTVGTAFIRAGAFADIAVALAKKHEKPEIVQHWIDLATTAAQKDTMPVMSMSSVAEADIYAGHVEAAEAIAKQFAGGSGLSLVNAKILDAHLDLGHVKEAQAMAATQSDPEQQLNFALSLGACQLKAGDKDGAAKSLHDALGLFDKMAGVQGFTNARQIAQLMGKLNGPAAAATWAREQKNPEKKVFALWGVVSDLPEVQPKDKKP